MLFLFGDPAHTTHAGMIPKVTILFLSCFGFRGFWKIDISTGFYPMGTKMYGKSDVSTGIVWAELRNRTVHGNDLGWNGKLRFLRELFGWDHRNYIRTGTGIKLNSRKVLRKFSHGKLPQDCPGKYHHDIHTLLPSTLPETLRNIISQH